LAKKVIQKFLKKNDFFYNIIKITIIVFFSYSMFAYFQQFSPGGDSELYGYSAINLSKGQYEIKNDFLQQTGSINFIPNNFRLTQFNTLVPAGNIGIYVLASFTYLVGGYYGLFYLGPVLATLLLICSERIGTNLFGKFAGLITLILVATDFIIYTRGQELGTDIIFTLFVLIGCFFLVKSLKNIQNYKNILLSSTFLSLAVFFRMNGIIFFPFELLIIVGYFIFELYKTDKKIRITNWGNLINSTRKYAKFLFFLIVPWLIFFLFFLSYNNYFFGGPLTTYEDVKCQVRLNCPEKENIIFSFLRMDSERLEWIKHYSVPLIPDGITEKLQALAPINTDEILGKNWLSIISLFMIGGILIFSIKSKNKQTEVIVIICFIVATLSFYSMSYIISTSNNINPDLQDRYMISNVPLSSLLIGFFLSTLINKKLVIPNDLKLSKKYFKIIMIILIIIFLIFSLNESRAIEKVKGIGFFVKNPEVQANKLTKSLEGLGAESVIIDHRGRRALGYDAIAFNWALGDPNSTFLNLKKVFESGYDVYTFKKYYTSGDPPTSFYKMLESKHGIILKDYSKTFCKMINTNVTMNSENNPKGDSVCYQK